MLIITTLYQAVFDGTSIAKVALYNKSRFSLTTSSVDVILYQEIRAVLWKRGQTVKHLIGMSKPQRPKQDNKRSNSPLLEDSVHLRPFIATKSRFDKCISMSTIDREESSRLQREFIVSEYGQLYMKARKEMSGGNKREGLDLLWQSFKAAPDKWSYRRFDIFYQYILHLEVCANSNDFANLEKVFRKKSEIALYKVCAGFKISILYYAKCEHSICADYLRLAVAAASKANAIELEKIVYFHQHVPVRDLIKIFVDNINEKLVEVERQDTHIKDNLSRSFYGGGHCDGCELSLGEAGVVNFMFCTRCKIEYYCSKECQKKAWEAGHKQACRKPSERKEGDVMYLSSYDEFPVFNNRYVKLVTLHDDSNWVVKLEEGFNIIVPTNRLFHHRLGLSSAWDKLFKSR